MTTTFGGLYDARARALADRYAKAHDLPDDRAIDLFRALALGLPLALLDRAFGRGRAQASGDCRAMAIARSAAGLLAATVRLLPVAGRARYAEEFRSELSELARAGAGHIRQLGYALRQLCNVLTMGIALRSPRRRSAAP
jgi:hypothetical protein